MYSGLMPVDLKDPSRSLFFIFQPNVLDPDDETLTIWLNGGPGCSSLEGFFQENGRFVWREGQEKPSINPYTWTNLTNVLWVEQPIGTGYSQGNVTATSQEDTAQDFLGFFKNFQKTFRIQDYEIYVTGESYAGRYVPFISAAMLDEDNPRYFDLQGKFPC
jgi:carboxypeptidase D